MTQTIGSRRQVWNGTAMKTSGGLTKTDLIMSNGRIVSKSKHFSAKKEMRLLKHGYGTQKGKFGYVKIGTKKHHKGHKKMKGGHVNVGSGLSPSGIDGQGITNYGALGSIGVQEAAGMAGGERHLFPSGIDGQGITNYGALGSIGVQEAAGMAGGERHKVYGGSGMKSMSEPGIANWNGDGIAGAGITVGDAGSANLQLLAGMAGGRRRTRGRGKSMHGGTTKPMPHLSPANVQNRALMA